MLLGVMVQLRTRGFVFVRFTFPLKWFSGVTVMVELADNVEFPDNVELKKTGEAAVMLKSWNCNVAFALRTRGPLVAVILNV